MSVVMVVRDGDEPLGFMNWRFTREGLLRGCGWRDGLSHGLIRADLPI